MGKIIETVAVERKHQIVLKIDVDNQSEFTPENLKRADVAIEFTSPHTAFAAVVRCLEYGVPVVSGSTGWYEHLEEAKKICIKNNGSMLCASNFSLGVNIFFEINKRLAGVMNNFSEYKANIEEIHHTQKLDAPSGTAITLAETIIDEINRLDGWELDGNNSAKKLPIHAIRRDSVPGTHSVKYSSEIDNIEIIHTAHNRKGFAVGAVLAAEYIHDKKGVFSMKDIIKSEFF